MPGKVEMRSAG